MRKEYDYDYTIHPDNSPKKFEEVCRRLKDKGFGDGRLVVDVDGSTYQEYQTKTARSLCLMIMTSERFMFWPTLIFLKRSGL